VLLAQGPLLPARIETLVPGTTCEDHPESRKRSVSLEKGRAVSYLLSPFATLDAPFFASPSVHVAAFDNRCCLATSPMTIRNIKVTLFDHDEF
jgi:hypothetical protein